MLQGGTNTGMGSGIGTGTGMGGTNTGMGHNNTGMGGPSTGMAGSNMGGGGGTGMGGGGGGGGNPCVQCNGAGGTCPHCNGTGSLTQRMEQGLGLGGGHQQGVPQHGEFAKSDPISSWLLPDVPSLCLDMRAFVLTLNGKGAEAEVSCDCRHVLSSAH